MTADPQVLHTQLLGRADDWLDVVLSPQPFAEAVRVVLKLHTPVTHSNGYPACSSCRYEWGDQVEYPCEEVKIIASALGVET